MLHLVLYGLLAIGLAIGLFLVAARFLPAGEQIAPPLRDEPPWDLPGRRLAAEDIEAVRLPVALRGYRFGETDLLLDRLAAELRGRDEEIARLRTGLVPADQPAEQPLEPVAAEEPMLPFEEAPPPVELLDLGDYEPVAVGEAPELALPGAAPSPHAPYPPPQTVRSPYGPPDGVPAYVPPPLQHSQYLPPEPQAEPEPEPEPELEPVPVAVESARPESAPPGIEVPENYVFRAPDGSRPPPWAVVAVAPPVGVVASNGNPPEPEPVPEAVPARRARHRRRRSDE